MAMSWLASADGGFVADRARHEKGIAAAATGSGAQLVEAGVAGDGQQPGAGGRVASKPRQGPRARRKVSWARSSPLCSSTRVAQSRQTGS